MILSAQVDSNYYELEEALSASYEEETTYYTAPEIVPVPFTPLPEARHQELIKELDYKPKPKSAWEKRREEREKRRRENKKISQEESTSWWDKLFERKRVFNLELPAGVIYLLLIPIILMLAYFIYRFQDEAIFSFSKAEKDAELVNIHEIEEESLTIRETVSLRERAENNGQFAIAIRLQYLELLKKLDELKLINYKRDKVNRAYIFEMDETDLGEDFAEVTEDFERNWYGQYPIDRLSYRLIARKFIVFHDRLSTLQTSSYA